MLFLLKLSRIFDYFAQWSVVDVMLCDFQSEDIKSDADSALLTGTLLLEPQVPSVRKQS